MTITKTRLPDHSVASAIFDACQEDLSAMFWEWRRGNGLSVTDFADRIREAIETAGGEFISTKPPFGAIFGAGRFTYVIICDIRTIRLDCLLHQ